MGGGERQWDTEGGGLRERWTKKRTAIATAIKDIGYAADEVLGIGTA